MSASPTSVSPNSTKDQAEWLPADSAAAQARFDERYITSSEICELMNVTRASVLLARRRGVLPDPIKVQGSVLFIWERTPEFMAAFDAWKTTLEARRRVNA